MPIRLLSLVYRFLLFICWDVEKKESLPGKFIGHCGLVGFHQHLAVFIETNTETRKPDDVETRRQTMSIMRPWEAGLRIPALDYEERTVAGKGSGSVSFALPEVDAGGTYDATLVFRAAPEPAPWPGNEVLPKIEAKRPKRPLFSRHRETANSGIRDALPFPKQPPYG